MSRSALSGLAAAALLVGPGVGDAAAQSGAAGQIEIGTYGSRTSFDPDALGLQSKTGAGARIGWFPKRLFSVELGADYTVTSLTATGAHVDVTRIGGTLLAHGAFFPLGTLYGGAGYERALYRGAGQGEDGGFHLVLGDRLSLGGRTALRVEGRYAFYSTNAFDPTGATTPANLSVNVGISVFGFGGPPRDSDRDMVANKVDRCPDTPLGATVDPDGCPLDSDGDRVFDGLDTCPGTPAGAFVDAAGCPTDQDGDSVFDGIDVCPDTPAGAVVDPNGCPIDSDEDGVFDGLDRCADTPRGATVDASGCPQDQDGDGVFDGLDRCPDTPAGTTVNASGCAADSDGDGVLDDSDQCPNTPPGTEVDPRGCTVDRDSDADGIPDSIDRCQNTAPGQNVDAVGCPILFVEQGGRRQPLVLKGVNFQTGSSALTDDSYAALDQVAASLVAYPEVRVEISGHSDNTGRRETNIRLSRERALAVKAYLASKGVDPGRMEAVGYGPDRPIATNTTPAGRAQNRRVELRVIEPGEQQR